MIFGLHLKSIYSIWQKDRCKYLILIFIIFLICILSALIRILPYVVNNYEFEVGFDTGTYERLLGFYDSSESWKVLPAYPDVPTAYTYYTTWMEAGFFVTLSISNGIINADVHWLFRYYLPVIVGIMTVLIAYVAGRNLSRSDLCGWISASLVAISYIQINAIDESYYRQIFATLVLIMSLVYLDRYIENKRPKDLALFTLLASGTVAYHLPVTMLAAFAYIFLFAFFIRRREKKSVRHIAISAVAAIILSSPAWAPKTGHLVDLFIGAVSGSIWRASTLPSGEGLWSGGGAIPSLFWDYPHILIGYSYIFSTIIIFSILGYIALRQERRLHYSIPLLPIILWIYIGLWFYFGNRFILNLDILLCIIAPLGIIYILKHLPRKCRKRTANLVTVILCAILIVPVAAVSVESQMEKTPYITENIEAIEWMKGNISTENSVIFAPDYLSADLIQLGYLMAIWDFSLTDNDTHPMEIAEEFMLNAPSNLSYVEHFFEEHPAYREREIYVLWGTWDLDRPLVVTKKLIPADDYAVSPYFECVYYGYAEILYIYKYIGPT